MPEVYEEETTFRVVFTNGQEATYGSLTKAIHEAERDSKDGRIRYIRRRNDN